MSANVTNDCMRVLTDARCTLRAPLRHLAMCLAQLANWRTGRGIAGQGRIARAVGVDTRTVRRLKAELQAAAPSPVAVAWCHRSRPDGLNGSDAYTIGLTPLGLSWLPAAPASGQDTGQLVRDTGSSVRDTGQLALPRSPVVPSRETPQNNQTENLFLGDSPLDSPRLMKRNATLLPIGWAPNATHAKSAERLGVDCGAAGAAFAVYWHERAGSERSRQEWDATFGGWLKRQAPQKTLTPAELEAAEVAAWRRSLEADES